MKRAFKDLVQDNPYETLNSEITGDYDKAHAVKCINGTFVGTEENGVASWLGIPYAKPPVGERRFKAPEYVDPGDKVFEAKYYGKGAYGSLGYPDCNLKQMSEDCLFLNIWVNADDQNVLVIAGPGDLRIKKDLLADQYKAVLPLVGYYQFMDKYFTPHYLLDIVDAREKNS